MRNFRKYTIDAEDTDQYLKVILFLILESSININKTRTEIS